MKLAFFISSLSGGGAEKMLTTIANTLANNGNDVHVISLEKRPQFYSLNGNVTLHAVSNRKHNKLMEQIKDYQFIKKCMKSIHADVNISFLTRCNLLLLLSGFLSKEKIIVCDRNNPLREHSKFVFSISNLLYKRANGVVVQTNQIKSFYWKSLQKKIFVQENPIDIQSLEKQLDGSISNKENVVISIGRLEPQKDFETLIRAFAHVSPEFNDWKLKIFGVGEKKDYLQKYIDERQMTDKVVLCGHTKKPFLELRKSKIFVLSTHYEGFPNALCEAMAAGLQCISSDCVSGPRELIENGVNGWLFEIGNDVQLATILKSCMSSNDTKHGTKAKESVKRLYLEKNITGWENIIKQVYFKKEK